MLNFKRAFIVLSGFLSNDLFVKVVCWCIVKFWLRSLHAEIDLIYNVTFILIKLFI